ncbi:MmgE/PrpD family protein [Plastoroseomonas arctica]|uniref:MmgE/PrpD family protein n=1 Tax=Plastoroseomonas arctica TaxID=1509237 RepID=A0AAF1JZ10_9PROT|nr:MmgE/PrpD family protein [Plastoroseomonas arctica]MBR0656320.1 MmgE/PrpD family protein [Plastoroseomonas arctica]
MDMNMPDSTLAPGPTRALANFVAGVELAKVDDFARHAARRHTIDTLGAMIAGATQDATLSVERAFAAAGIGVGQVAMAGVAQRYDVLSAAYIGGTSGHGLELDDGYRAGSVHPGGVVVPAALALGAQRHSVGRTFLAAIVAGYEVACRIAAACHPRARWRGFHNTGTVGVFASGCAAAVLLGFDADRVENVIGTAASSAAGLFTFLAGGDVKRTHPGHAAREGLLAALLTEAGLPAPRGALEFKDGFFNAYAGGDMDYTRLDIMAAGDSHPSSAYAVANCYMKPYAACRHIHAMVDAVLDMAASEGLTADQVAAVDIGSYAVAATHGTVGWTEMTTAQMSIPFVVATALVRGRVTLADFGEAERADPAILGLTGRIVTEVDAECDEIYPRKRGAKVAVTTADGRVLRRTVMEPYGSASKPLSDDAVAEKFLGLAGPRLGDARAQQALEMLWRVDELTDVAPLAEILAA